MKQTIDAIMQIATLIMGVICFGIGIINIKEAACECHKIFNEKKNDKGKTKESAVQVLRTPSNGG